MSIDLNWETLTTGPDGQELAHRIRDFIHSKFQTVPLPRFIKSVTVHDFEFGTIGPELELKDITDPLPDFYEEDAEDEEGSEGGSGDGSDGTGSDGGYGSHFDQRRRDGSPRPRGHDDPRRGDRGEHPGGGRHRHDLSGSSHRTVTGMGAAPAPSGTRGGVPGGTSNLLHHFHSHLTPAGWSGTQTPLAAMAGAHLGSGHPTGGAGGSGYFYQDHQGHQDTLNYQNLQEYHEQYRQQQQQQRHQHQHQHHQHQHSLYLTPSSPSHSRNPSQGSSISIGDYRDSLRPTPGAAAATASSPPANPTLLQQTLREKHSVSTLAPTSAGGASRPPTRDGREGGDGKLTGMGTTAQQMLGGSAIEDHDDSSPGGDGDDDGDMDRTLLLGQATGSGGRPRLRERRAEDTQAVFRIRYAGDVKLLLTADILLDYPMPSFVGIPVRLSITGLTFDGVGVLANIRKRLHFCFLSPEDALAAVGDDDLPAGGDDEREPGGRGVDDGGFGAAPATPGRRPATASAASPAPSHGGAQPGTGSNIPRTKMGGLLQEVRVESEIGQREGGKQSLKNVGKVERFVLEQVRRIFEEEFVYPSFWTFLV